MLFDVVKVERIKMEKRNANVIKKQINSYSTKNRVKKARHDSVTFHCVTVAIAVDFQVSSRSAYRYFNLVVEMRVCVCMCERPLDPSSSNHKGNSYVYYAMGGI